MKGGLRRILVGAIRIATRLGGVHGRRVLVEALEAESAAVPLSVDTIDTPGGSLRFWSLGAVPVWRARSLLTKEPETIEWIDGFSSDDTFWDVGANVGVYGLYAGLTRKCRVLAFEPSAANYLLLNRNIEINDIQDLVRAYCVAFADVDQIEDLNMQSTEFGGALSSFATPIDVDGKTFVPSYRQGMIGFSIDGFIRKFMPPFPNHLKIDVDGIEDRIIAGAMATLTDRRLKSLSVELDAGRPEYTDSVAAKIESAGLRLVSKRHADMFDGGKFQNIFNYLFRR